MLKIKMIAILILMMLIPAVINAEPVRIAKEMEDAFFLSKDLKKDAIIVFTADWCGNCLKMKKDLDNNLSVLDDKIICYINIDKNEYYKTEYKVRNIPDYFILRNGVELKRQRGYKNIEDFKKWIHDAK